MWCWWSLGANGGTAARGVTGSRVLCTTPRHVTFVPSDPFYMILNTALNPWADASLDSGLPVEHRIDYVRWCQREGVE